jgi:hypothetical protein
MSAGTSATSPDHNPTSRWFRADSAAYVTTERARQGAWLAGVGVRGRGRHAESRSSRPRPAGLSPTRQLATGRNPMPPTRTNFGTKGRPPPLAPFFLSLFALRKVRTARRSRWVAAPRAPRTQRNNRISNFKSEISDFISPLCDLCALCGQIFSVFHHGFYRCDQMPQELKRARC